MVDMIKLNLKEQTSLFDWTWTDTLTEINIILQKLINGDPIITIRNTNGNDYFADTNIVTSHYYKTDYQTIVNRRAERLLFDIKNNKQILFIRDDKLSTIKEDELQKFAELIKQINPELEFKVLLLSEKDHFTKINIDFVHHKVYDAESYPIYINDCFTQNDL